MKKALTSTLFTSFFLLAVAGNAEEETYQDEISNVLEKNVIVDSRPLSPESKKLMEQKRQEESEECENPSDEETLELTGTTIPIKWNNLIALTANELHSTAANYTPYLYHWIENIPQENIVEIEDGSEWIFDKNDAHVLRNWRASDTIVISPKGNWLWSSNYAYVMTNKDLSSSINVNLMLGPIAFGPRSTWIIGLDDNLGQVYVLNGQGDRTVWEVSHTDLYLFKEWQHDDTLIIGENDGWLWWFSAYNCIIINVNSNHFVRARQISSSASKRMGDRA
ncbi:MAG: hypothetical protein K1000chlam2_01466 [Chlamydiae bacterium]|nr:hypothetical protein [Chlamydiota bacterium]